jgi:hypothetical protein
MNQKSVPACHSFHQHDRCEKAGAQVNQGTDADHISPEKATQSYAGVETACEKTMNAWHHHAIRWVKMSIGGVSIASNKLSEESTSSMARTCAEEAPFDIVQHYVYHRSSWPEQCCLHR